MKVGLIDVDGHNFPNLPLMKLAAYHKTKGDSVEWYEPLFSGHMDRVYMSKVFSFTQDYEYFVDATEIIKGGTGYNYPSGGTVLNDEIEHIYPDYSIYYEKIPEVKETAYGFLTRGCPRGCDFCIVKDKEGRTSRKVADLTEFWRGQKRIVLLDPMYELSLLAGNGYTQELTAYEKTRLVERTKAALIRAKKEDGLEIKGKMRDLIASMLNESSTNVARMESINNNATPEIKEQLKSGSIGVTAAYEAAKLSEAEQKEIAEQAAAGKEIRANEIAQKVAEKKAAEKADKPEEPRPGDDYEIAHPESITSLCYQTDCI